MPHRHTQVYGAGWDPPKGAEGAGRCARQATFHQQSWLIGEVPDDRKLANVTPVYKKDRKEYPRNYRCASLTSVLGKVIEQIILSAIMWHKQDNQAISPSQ